MRHLADQPPHGVARQPRVGVEGEDIADVLRKRWLGAGQRHERGVCGPAQQSVQFVELAALALPANPAPFAFVPNPSAMQQEEARARRRRAVTSIEAFYAVAGDRRPVPRRPRARSASASIQSDSSAKCRSPSGLARWWISSRSTCSAMSSGVVKQRRHGDDRAQRFGHAAAKLEARQRNRVNEKRDPSVDKRHGRRRSRESLREPRVL